MSIEWLYFRRLFVVLGLFFMVVTSSVFFIQTANAKTSESLSPQLKEQIRRLGHRSKEIKSTIKGMLMYLPKGITPAVFFNQHNELIIEMADKHAYASLIALNKLGVDLKKINQASNGKFSNIISNNASIDTAYGQGREIAQLENILGLKQYNKEELEGTSYINSVYHINIDAVSHSSVWKNRRETLTWEEQKKYLQWTSGRRHPYVHFRTDGVVGITGFEKYNYTKSMGGFDYTTDVTWNMEGTNLIINWYDGIKFKFPHSDSTDIIHATSSVKGWRSAIIPSWRYPSSKNNVEKAIALIAKNKSLSSKKSTKPTDQKVITRQTTQKIDEKKLVGVWVAEKPSKEGAISMLELRPDGLLLPWKKFDKRQHPLPFPFYRNINEPQYIFGSILTLPKSNGHYFEAPFSPAFNMIFNWPHKKDPGFDDWELIDNNILRLSRRFYQIKTNDDKLILRPYAICPIRIKTASECIKKKIIAKQGNKTLKNWTFKPLEKKQQDKHDIYSTAEFLKYLPVPKDAKFKLRTAAKLPDYVSLLKSSKYLAGKKIPDFIITDSIIPTFRRPSNAAVYRTANDLKLALQLGFGKWLVDEQFNNEPVCKNYIKQLTNNRYIKNAMKDSIRILQDFCNSKSTTTVSKANDTNKNKLKATIPVINSQLVGCWNWSNGPHIVINKDGSVRNGAVNATWKYINRAKNIYSITWPSFVDTLSLINKGVQLSGSNNLGFPISASRKTGNSSSFIGSWLWSNNITVNINHDNTSTAGNLKGTWHQSGKNWIIEWPIIDNIVVAKDGRSLTVKNQFGVATAKRDVSCKGK